jgi:hypothetical protein
MRCGLTWVDNALHSSFYRLGVTVGRHPGYFLVVPVLLTLLCVTGFQRIKYEMDPEYLFSPVMGEGKQERAVVESFFRPNYTSRFNVGRITRPGEDFSAFSSGSSGLEQGGGGSDRVPSWREWPRRNIS